VDARATFKQSTHPHKQSSLKPTSLASRYARLHRLPRIYLAANSGARIGMADSVKGRFKVAWQKEEDPNQGFKYLYLTKEDYEVGRSVSLSVSLSVDNSNKRLPPFLSFLSLSVRVWVGGGSAME
jgi:hypothetical protein